MARLLLDSIRWDGGTQSRAKLDDARVDEYAEQMRDGDTFPPVIVFHDGTTYWPADGFHRGAAAKKAGLVHIEADVRKGTKTDCIRFAVGANREHDHSGLRRTNADKRRAVEMYLTLIWSEGKDESDRIVSDICGVDKTLVMRARDELVQNTSSPKPPSHRLGKDGKMHPATKRKTDTKDDAAPEPAPVSEPALPRNPPIRTASPATIALDEKVAALVSDGFGTGDIAKELGVDPHNVSESKRRLGLTRTTCGNPLMSLTEQAEQHATAWELAVELIQAKARSSTQEQRAALSAKLVDLVRAARRLMSVLAKSEEGVSLSC
jgi:hypothetical protein